MSSTKEYVIWLKDCSSQYHLKVGGKNANLGQMIQIGLRVPPGFAVTTHAFDTFWEKERVRSEIIQILSEIAPDDVKALEEAGRDVRVALSNRLLFLKAWRSRSGKAIKNYVSSVGIQTFRLLCDPAPHPKIRRPRVSQGFMILAFMSEAKVK